MHNIKIFRSIPKKENKTFAFEHEIHDMQFQPPQTIEYDKHLSSSTNIH